jgi:hypothetical protein
MNITEIQSKLIELIESYDEITPLWANAKALYNKGSEMRKIKLQVLASQAPGKTNAEKERAAYCTQEYKEYLNQLFKQEVDFHSKDARKRSIEQQIDIYRSLGSWNRNQVDNTI